MKDFTSALASVLALCVGACVAIPVPAPGCNNCQTLNKVCPNGVCINIRDNGVCSFRCNCTNGKTGSFCNEEQHPINVAVIKDTVMVKFNPLQGLDLSDRSLFGPLDMNMDFFPNGGPAADTNTDNTTTTTTSTTSTTTKKTTTTPTQSRSGTGASGALGSIVASQRSQTVSSSGQSAAASSSSTGHGQTPTGSASPASPPSTASGGAGSAISQRTSVARAGPQSPAEVPVSSSGSSSNSSNSSVVPSPGGFRTPGAALSSASLGPPANQGNSSGTASTDLLHKLHAGAHPGTSSSSLSSAGTAVQQSGTNSTGGGGMSASASTSAKSSVSSGSRQSASSGN